MIEVKTEAADSDGISDEELAVANEIEIAIENDKLLDQETTSVMIS